jgi:hypothetical protein
LSPLHLCRPQCLVVALLRRTMTTRQLSSPMPLSRSLMCRTSILSSQTHWTSPAWTMPGGGGGSGSSSSNNTATKGPCPSFFNPWTCTIQIWLDPGGQHLATSPASIGDAHWCPSLRSSTTGRPPFTPPLVPLPIHHGQQ